MRAPPINKPVGNGEKTEGGVRKIFCPAGIESAERIFLKPMKKLLDHFWRKRPEAADSPKSQTALPNGVAAETPSKAVRPIATISVAPRTVRPAWQAATGPAPGKRLALQCERPEPAETLTLTLGDFWDRLPSDLLASATPDPTTPLTFDLATISERIGRGDSGIPLTEIAQRIPQAFRANAVIAPDRLIMFPWKAIRNLLVQIRDGATAHGLTLSGVEMLSLKVRARRLRRSGKAATPTPQPTQPASSGAPWLETAPASKSSPEIQARLALTTPALLPEPEAAAPLKLSGLGSTSTPGAAAVPFLNQKDERQLAAIRAERDGALSELSTLRAEILTQHARATTDQEALSAIGEKLSGLEAQLAAATKAAATFRAERDAALAQVEAVRAEQEAVAMPAGSANPDLAAAATRAAELVAERDAARAQAAKALADCETARALAAEQTAERNASLARLKEVSTERDGALTRAADLTIERDRENSHAAELGGEMAAAVSHAAECAGERDAAIARSASLAKERDAALARIAELEAVPPNNQPTPPTQAQSSPEPPPAADIEGCRNTMQALYAERDALRQEQQRLTARLVVAGAIVDKAAVEAAAANQPISDAYGGLFPNRTATSPLVIVLLMVLLAYGIFIVAKTDLSQTTSLTDPPAAAERAAAPAPVSQEFTNVSIAQQNAEPATTLEEVAVAPSDSAADDAPSPDSSTALSEDRPLD